MAGRNVTPQRTVNLLRSLFVIFACFVGVSVGPDLFGSPWIGAGAGLVFGLVVVLADRLLKGVTLRTFSSATFGLLMGLFFSWLLLSSEILKPASDDVRWIVSLLAYSAFGYLGMMLAIRSGRDEFSLIIPYVRFRQSAVQDLPLIVDSNILIDGRLERLRKTGFIGATLIIPRFVLDELQLLADSGDSLRRERGRRALTLLEELRQHDPTSVTVHESTGDTETKVDAKLVHLAQLLGARLLTNDSNLCKIARLQNVTALNLNELAEALRPQLAAGDQVEIALVKEGKESHQAVGYLPDGTMVVVNHARAHLGQTMPIAVSSVVHTTAGRLFFAELEKH
ncbi:MAG TPA: PIN domain-containing protein [Chthoniobacteraceae bacterium]|jgi:uncharacterized protein YacL|nr:PIN domain-containing protein [Chthoniobacteraceae bacterium]